ncbi:hypothetical protein NUSPORA_01713 [Nucleospora cyclopteri]
MIVKLLVLLSHTLCYEWPEKPVAFRISEIYSMFNESVFLKNFLPEFYDFDESLDETKLISHYKNIIEKSTDIYLIDFVKKEYELDKKMFKIKISCCNINMEVLNQCFVKPIDSIEILQKIESVFFNFLYKKIKLIADLDYNNRTIYNIFKKDSFELSFLMQFLFNIKIFISRKFRFDPLKSKNINIISELLNFLHNIKNNINNKINTNIILKKSCKEYLNNYFSEIYLVNSKQCLYYNGTVQDRKKLFYNKNVELETFFNEKFDLELLNYSEIEKKFFKLANLILIISRENLFDLKIDCFIAIFLYLNYLRNTIYLQKYFLEDKVSIETNLPENIDNKSQEFSKILLLVIYQKNLISKLIINFCENKCRNEFSKISFENIKDKHNILKNYIESELLYDIILDKKLSKADSLQKKLKSNYKHYKLLTQLRRNTFLSPELFNNNFGFFKVQCFFILRNSSLYLCMYNLITKKHKITGFHKILDELIQKINTLFSNDLDSANNNKYKNLFLKFFEENLKEKKVFIENLFTAKKRDCGKKIIHILLSDLKLQIKFYEIEKKVLNIEEINDFAIKDSFASNSTINETQSICSKTKNIYLVKPKKFWEKNWKTSEKELYLIQPS